MDRGDIMKKNETENYVERDILINSYYLINLFEEHAKKKHEESASITNLKLQKLMYFVEAYYMVRYPDENELFNSQWNAWNYGPVNQILYNYYRKFGSMEIMLTSAEIAVGEDLPEKNKNCISKIYELFGNLDAFELVTLTHMKDSPWDSVTSSGGYDFNKLNSSIIPKKITKNWFEKEFDFIFQNDEGK